ncbi:MAG TPA: flagellar filament capping protein FliD [Candidatus Acidoferrales bacterium]|nr:flagellar filament capping protein FliD [Candidatus Acidoferrales bacterium]
MSSDSSTVYGTNVAPISFPGIVSGIDYNEIIDKLTQLSLAPTTQLNAQIATLNNANTELIKISNLLSSVQNALGALSNPNLFSTYQAVSGDPSDLSATGIPGVVATPGLYTIDSVKAATNTSILSSASAGHAITDLITTGQYAGDASDTVPLAYSYARVTPENGQNGEGSVTVDGVSISYNVDTQSLDQILNNITSQVDSKADAGFLATLVNGVVEFSSSDAQISLGSNSDQGNLLQVFQLSNAQLINSGSSGFIEGTSNVGGINPDADFNASGNAGFVTPVTAGYFTINGVKIDVSEGENLNDILSAINSSSAGVTAVFNSVSGQIELTNQNSGPQSIVLGASGDTSNFLTAAGLTAASGAKTTVGAQSAITVQNPDGTSTTYYNNSNTVTNAVPGISLTISGNTTTPFTLDVTQNTTLLVSTLQNFVSIYNAAVTEINNATAPPIVLATSSALSVAQSIPGGVLWNDPSAQSIIPELESIVGGFLGNNSTYNSLAQAGLLLNSSFATVQATSIDAQDGETSPVQNENVSGTDGHLAPLNVSAFLAAYASNPNAVQDLIVGANSLTTQLGEYLTTITGAPTLLNAGPVGNIPAVSLIQNDENGNNDTITSLQQQIAQITDEANQQANILRSGFVDSETAIAGLQAEQQELAATFGFSTTSSSSSSSS